jgi:alcohol dehydrogenase (cytochrome c)
MPPSTLTTAGMRGLIAFVRTFRENIEDAPTRLSVTSEEGPLQGVVLTQSATGLALRDDDGRIHLLRRAGDQYRTVTSQADWPTYNGQPTGSRFSALTGIDTANVGRLAPAWTFTLDGASRLEVTPVVVDGVMYVTTANECYALDAGSGRQLWHFKRPRTRGLSGDAAGGINRGVAVAGDRVFMVTDHAHVIALNRFTGALLWETEMADWHQNYNATGAPLVVGNLIVTGTSGGDEGVRGFVAAFDQSTGKEAWRFWTAPRAGEPGADTWRGKGIAHPGATTWLTGTYDPELDTVYWPTGNPSPDLIGVDRRARRQDRHTAVAFSIHAARRVGLRRAGDAGAGRRDLAEPAAQAARAGKPQRLLLRARSHRRHVPARQAVREERDVGDRTRREGTADRGAGHGAHAGRTARVSIARRRVELVLDVVQSGDWPVLRPDQR